MSRDACLISFLCSTSRLIYRLTSSLQVLGLGCLKRLWARLGALTGFYYVYMHFPFCCFLILKLDVRQTPFSKRHTRIEHKSFWILFVVSTCAH